MGGVIKELKRQWAFWTVIHFSGGMKTLVNQVEQPFARSLVVCDTPIEANSSFTGSAYCGDRLKVIGEGFSISSVGQAQENFAMLCSLTLVAIIAGALGRKVAVLIGLFGTTLSVTLFTIASTSPEMGLYLFAMGQGLQGLFPIDYIVGLILLDISSQPGADGVATFQLSAYSGTIGALLWGVGFGNVVQLLELSDYRMVWTVILVINVVVLLLAICVMPETKRQVEKNGDSAASKLMQEVLSYRQTIGDWKARRFLLMVFCESCWKHCPFGVVPIQLMAFHGWTQTQVVAMLFFMQPFGLVCMPIVGSCCKKYGYRRTWLVSLFLVYASLYLNVFTIGVSGLWPAFSMYFLAALSGFMPLKGYVDSKFSTPEQMTRFTSVQWIMGYFLGMGVGPFYASVFNAKAEGYFARSLPNLLSIVPMAIQTIVIAVGMYEIDNGRDGFKVTLNLMDEAAVLLPEIFRLASKEQGPLAEEGWKGAGLEDAFGKSLAEAGGPFADFDAFNTFFSGLATSNETGLKAMHAVKKAMPTARQWAGVEATTEPPPEDKKEK